jgi:hypothetical protein
MLAKLRSQLSFANVASALALFVALSTGGAFASHLVVDSSDVVDNSLTGADVRGKPGTSTAPAVNGSLTTDDIAGQQANAANGTPLIAGTLTQWDVKNGALVGGDLADNTVGGGKVTDNSIKGAEVDESTLGQVPSAALAGIGRWTSPEGECNPESASFFTCAFTSITLPTQTRVLMIGVVKAQDENFGAGGTGQCLLATQFGNIPSSTSGFDVRGFDQEHVPLIATVLTGPGSVDFAVRCNDLDGGIRYFDTAVAAVALAPN